MMELFEAYTSTDHQLVKDLSKFGCYLIGGTAIDYWCNKFNLKKARHRSKNDIDFYSPANNKQLSNVKEYLQTNGFVGSVDGYVINVARPGQEVDILLDYEKLPSWMFLKQDGIAIMSPVYLFSSKFERYINTTNKQRRDTDKVDLIQLLWIIDHLNLTDKLEDFLANNRSFTVIHEVELNKLISLYNEKH